MNHLDTISILLIEDNQVDTLLLSDLLENLKEFKATLTVAETLAQGISETETSNFNVVLLDLGLPDSQGVATFNRFHQQAPHLPVLILTGLNDLGLSRNALRQGAQDYLIKNALKADQIERAIRYAIERNKLNLELNKSYLGLKKLTAKLEQVREDERTRISREIHDGLGQKLTALKMDITWLDNTLTNQLDQSLQEKVNKRINESRLLIDSSMNLVHGIAVELRPSTLDHLGLADAIRDESRRFHERTQINMDLALDDSVKVHGTQLATALFRIFQELSTNIAKHAKASETCVRLYKDDNYLVLEVEDNGIGIQDGMLEKKASLGMLGMRERVSVLQGSVTITSSTESGTKVCIRIPLPTR